MLIDCGYIGTNGVKGNSFQIGTNNTTPDINLLYKYLKMFSDDGLSYASIETSSEGLLHNRVNGISFDVGVLTNISEDHLNVHKTLSNYIDSKIKLFKLIKEDGYAVLNHDDRFFDKFKENCKCNVFSYGKDKKSDLRIVKFIEKDNSTEISFSYKDVLYEVESSLRGEYNVYNLMAAISVLICLGFSVEDAIERVKYIKQAEGRCEVFDVNKFKVVLDYAHTENGLKSILSYLNNIKKNRIITITGSAGGREKEKRHGMGKVVQELSDLVIYTMDDPRYEKVIDIISDMKQEDKDNYIIIEDREEAITKAFEMAKDGDIILVAGKGRDTYMAIEDRKEKYCDLDVINKLIEKY
jgi:UDP-N-acetylmuramoyl-L-alanyl-D-glutamate--2,6-diaminopimelate ligase